jgi:hypothetical protein
LVKVVCAEVVIEKSSVVTESKINKDDFFAIVPLAS